MSVTDITYDDPKDRMRSPYPSPYLTIAGRLPVYSPGGVVEVAHGHRVAPKLLLNARANEGIIRVVVVLLSVYVK